MSQSHASQPAQGPSVKAVARRNLVFIHGKGGVGKSTIAESIAIGLGQEGARVLLAEFENPTRPAGELRALDAHSKDAQTVWHLNAEASLAFEEYAELKIDQLSHHAFSRLSAVKLGGLGSLGKAGLSKLFTQNKLIKYLSKAAPGIRELVLLGKVWHERNRYDHVIVDLPSTGYGLAMFQSTANFAKLFGGGPISQDAVSMLKTFEDPAITGHLIVALPEEMPLRESIELNGHLKELFPANRAAYLVNRRFPADLDARAGESPDRWASPYASSVGDYIRRRGELEAHNLKLWDRAQIPYEALEFLPPSASSGSSAESSPSLAQRLSEKLKEGGSL